MPIPTTAARALAALAIAAPVAFAQEPPSAPSASAAKATPAGPEAPWPRAVQSGDTTLTIHHPQLDSWNGFDLVARSATGTLIF